MKFRNIQIKILAVVAAVFTFGLTTPGHSAVIVDGLFDADYGAAKSVVTFNASAPEGNFQAPTSESDSIGYSIYMINQSGTVYTFLQATGPAALSFANVYYGINGGGSTIGFEVGNQDAFTPGVPGSVPVAISYATTASTFEFAIPESYFENSLGGLASAGGQPGDKLVLRLSQSFGYSVAGGAGYGADRLGAVTLSSAVPEPSTWLMMFLGFAGLGFVGYRRSTQKFAAQVA